MFELKNIIILCYPTHSYYTQQFIPGIPCWTLQRDKQDTEFGKKQVLAAMNNYNTLCVVDEFNTLSVVDELSCQYMYNYCSIVLWCKHNYMYFNYRYTVKLEYAGRVRSRSRDCGVL